MLNVNLKCIVIRSDLYQGPLRLEAGQGRKGVKCLINITCQKMKMSFVQISSREFLKLLMIRLTDADCESPWHSLKPSDW